MEIDGSTLSADGLEEALIGLGSHGDRALLVYSLPRVREIVAARGVPPSQVQDYIDFHIVGAWLGPGTPVFVEPMDYPAAVAQLES